MRIAPRANLTITLLHRESFGTERLVGAAPRRVVDLDHVGQVHGAPRAGSVRVAARVVSAGGADRLRCDCSQQPGLWTPDPPTSGAPAPVGSDNSPAIGSGAVAPSIPAHPADNIVGSLLDVLA